MFGIELELYPESDPDDQIYLVILSEASRLDALRRMRDHLDLLIRSETNRVRIEEVAPLTLDERTTALMKDKVESHFALGKNAKYCDRCSLDRAWWGVYACGEAPMPGDVTSEDKAAILKEMLIHTSKPIPPEDRVDIKPRDYSKVPDNREGNLGPSWGEMKKIADDLGSSKPALEMIQPKGKSEAVVTQTRGTKPWPHYFDPGIEGQQLVDGCAATLEGIPGVCGKGYLDEIHIQEFKNFGGQQAIPPHKTSGELSGYTMSARDKCSRTFGGVVCGLAYDSVVHLVDTPTAKAMLKATHTGTEINPNRCRRCNLVIEHWDKISCVEATDNINTHKLGINSCRVCSARKGKLGLKPCETPPPAVTHDEDEEPDEMI